MKKFRFIAPLLLLLRLSHAVVAEPILSDEDNATTPSVKVLVGENVDGALVEAKGPYRVIDPNTSKELSHGYRSKRYYLQQQSDGLKWGEGYPGIFQIKIVPESDETSILINGIQYKGSLEVYDVGGQIHMVNEVPIEVFLKSMLTDAFAKTELDRVAFDALAIVARTDLYYKVIENKHAFWHLDAKKINYRGYANSHIRPEIARAVDATQFLVMIHKNQTFPTTWTENCAGMTADFRSIFRKNSAVPDGVASTIAKKSREKSKWQYTLELSAFEKKVGVTGIKSIDLYKEPKTGKIYGVRVKGTKGTKSMSFPQFWNCVGRTNVKSNDMKVTLDAKKKIVLFEGYGVGPGVGLCVFSANAMAKEGDSAPQILANFYPLTSIAKIEYIPKHMYRKDEDFIKYRKIED